MKTRLLAFLALAFLAFSTLGLLAKRPSDLLLGILVLGLCLVGGIYVALFLGNPDAAASTE